MPSCIRDGVGKKINLRLSRLRFEEMKIEVMKKKLTNHVICFQKKISVFDQSSKIFLSFRKKIIYISTFLQNFSLTD